LINHKLGIEELSFIAYNLYTVKLRAPKILDMIMNYPIEVGWTVRDYSECSQKHSVNFFHAISYLNGNTQNKEFIKLTRDYIDANLKRFSNGHLTKKIIHIFKFMQGLDDRELKGRVEKAMEEMEAAKNYESETDS